MFHINLFILVDMGMQAEAVLCQPASAFLPVIDEVILLLNTELARNSAGVSPDTASHRHQFRATSNSV